MIIYVCTTQDVTTPMVPPGGGRKGFCLFMRRGTSKKAKRAARVAAPFVPIPNQIKTVILNEKQTCAATTMSRVTLWRLRRRGEFPAPVRLSRNRMGWTSESVQSWINSRTGKSA